MSAKQVALYLRDGNDVQVELIAGLIDERLVPGFMVMMDRFRPYFPVEIYYDRRRVLGYTVNSSGVFHLRMKQVRHG